jgi:chemotaxis response regulator CheB
MPTQDLPADAPTNRIHLLVADDDDRVRSICDAAAPTGRLRSVMEAKDGAEADQLGRAHSPDVVVLDLKMPRLDGGRRQAASAVISSSATWLAARRAGRSSAARSAGSSARLASTTRRCSCRIRTPSSASRVDATSTRRR